MSKTLAPIAALLISAAIYLAGNGLQTVLIPLAAGLKGISDPQIGLLGSIYFLGFALGCWQGPRLLKRVGHIRAFTAMTAIAAASAAAYALTPYFLSWALLRFLTGISFAALYLVIESWLNERATNQNRGTVFGLYTFINLTVVTAGQMMVTFYPPDGVELFLLNTILIAAAAVPIALSVALAPAPVEAPTIRIRHLFNTAPAAILGGLFVGLANGAFWMLMPRYGVGIGMSIDNIATFMAAAVLTGAALQLPLGRLSDGRDRRHIMLLTAVLAGGAALGLAILGELGRSGWMVLVAGGAFGGFAFPLYAISVAHLNDWVGEGEFVEAAGGMLLTYAAGAVVGPIIASQAMAWLGPPALFLYIGATLIALALVLVVRLIQKGHSVEPEDQADFVAVSRTSVAAGALDPRAEDEL